MLRGALGRELIQRIEDRPGSFEAAIARGAIVRVDANDHGVPRLGFFRSHVGVRREDHEIAWLVQVRRGAVDGDGARAAGAFQGVRHESRPARHVPDMNGFVREDLRRVEQIGVDGDAALVFQICVRDGGAMNLGFEYAESHETSMSLVMAAVPFRST